MRRRPMEFWWIAAFGLIKLPPALQLAWQLDGLERGLLVAQAAAFVCAAVLLLNFSPAGRVATLVLFGVEAGDQTLKLLAGHGWHSQVGASLSLSFCLWMAFYLCSASTARLCQARPAADSKPAGGRAPALLASFPLLDFLETGAGIAGTAASFFLLGLPLELSVCIGLGCYILYGLALADWARRRWMACFAGCERGYPAADAETWRLACKALARGDLAGAREHFETTSPDGRRHPAGRLFARMLDWHTLLADEPHSGAQCLRRCAFEHDWKPGEEQRKRMADYAECAGAEALRALIDERAETIEGLVRAGAAGESFFCNQADRILSRITGDTFAFNAPESWVEWWEACRADWSGDTGAVSLVARLLRLDPAAANVLAGRVAGRAEEPLLKEFTAQVVFLNAMQKAIREHEGVESFIRQPQRMLLVPELTDVVGLLHADSELLDNLGMSAQSVRRRLLLRVPLVDYIGRLWRRYPCELGAEMPWLLKTLTGKNLGVLRARAKFEAWWPGVRESFMRHDRAVIAGRAAMALNDAPGAERAFREALRQQPRELSSRYNLALCVMHRQAHDEAASLVRELTQLEPREPYWWMVLGTIHRNVGRSTDAHAAFRKALELHAPLPRVALHIGLTFARDCRDAEAIQHFRRWLGTNPSASRIEELVSTLESQGLWKLAGHYREEAFRRGLDQPGDGPDEPGDVAA